MALKTTLYRCNTCCHRHTHRHPETDKPLRRWILPCHSKKCKGKHRIFYPARFPITGDYR